MWFQISWWIDALFSFHLSSLMPSICAWSQYIRRAKLKDIKSRWHLLQVNSWRNTTDSCIQGFDSIYKFAYLLESQLDVHFRPTARHDRTKPRFCQTMTFSPQQTSNHDSNLAPEITANYWLRSILVQPRNKLISFPTSDWSSQSIKKLNDTSLYGKWD